MDFRVDIDKPRRCRINLGPADCTVQGDELTVNIRKLHRVEVRNDDSTDSRAGYCLKGIGTDSADTKYCNG